MTGFHKDLSGIQDLAAQGKTRAQIAEAMGVTTQTVRKYARLNGISITRAGCCGQLVGRNERMETMFRQGITLADIGKQFDAVRTRENKEVDKAAWSRWVNDGEGIEWSKLTQIMDKCGNDAPLLWMLNARGYACPAFAAKRLNLNASCARRGNKLPTCRVNAKSSAACSVI